MTEPCKSCRYNPTWHMLASGDFVGVCKLFPHPPLYLRKGKRWVYLAEEDKPAIEICERGRKN